MSCSTGSVPRLPPLARSHRAPNGPSWLCSAMAGATWALTGAPDDRDQGEAPMTFELGGYTFGNTPRTANGGYGPTAQAIRDALEAVRLADEVGLGFFGLGEHHTTSMPQSSPTSMVIAAAASTQRIILGTTVTVLSTDEPIRVFQQLATAAAIAPGRIEAVAGRGSSTITFPLFDYDEHDYDMLYGSKLDLLLALNA